MEAADMARLLTHVAQSIRQHHVALRVDTESLETAYIAVEGDAVVVHDRGQTFLYIANAEHSGDGTYTAWSEGTAVEALRNYAVDLVGHQTKGEGGFRIQVRLAGPDDVGAAVERLSSAVEAVLSAHMRADLG